MLGAITGDIVGSRFEWNNYRAKDFELFVPGCFFTDDSVMTLAIGNALREWCIHGGDLGATAVAQMQEIGRHYPDCGYGGRFAQWMFSPEPKPYNSYGNGAAMRVSTCGHVAKTLEETLALALAVTEVTHNHPEGLKGAQATAACVFMALHGSTIDEIREHVVQNYYPLDFTLDEIRPTYHFNETCQETVPQAIVAFLESNDFEDAIRNAISIGGDSDTVAAIAGGIAGAYYGVPLEIREQTLGYLDNRLLMAFKQFEEMFGTQEP